jgi:hypothetical protein
LVGTSIGFVLAYTSRSSASEFGDRLEWGDVIFEPLYRVRFVAHIWYPRYPVSDVPNDRADPDRLSTAWLQF